MLVLLGRKHGSGCKQSEMEATVPATFTLPVIRDGFVFRHLKRMVPLRLHNNDFVT